MKRVFSGIQPTGNLTIGNYLGALKRFAKMQDEYECFYCIVDLHALTVMPDPETLRQNTLNTAAIYFAAGLDPKKSTTFVQSHVPQHSEMAWLLQCLCYYGELGRMTQFKDKREQIQSRKKGQNSITSGLFTYPVLMAGDILLYDTDIVPVGEDQKQHVELARDLASRANQIVKEGTFVVPEPFIPKVGGKIMSLRDPSRKMSKSDPLDASRINLLDPPEVILKKIRKSKTDSEGIIQYDPKLKAGVSNLLVIESLFTDVSIEKLENEYQGLGYGYLKKRVAEAIIAALEPLQERYNLLRDSAEIRDYLTQGSERAREVASQTLKRYQENIGLYR